MGVLTGCKISVSGHSKKSIFCGEMLFLFCVLYLLCKALFSQFVWEDSKLSYSNVKHIECHNNKSIVVIALLFLFVLVRGLDTFLVR